MKVVQRLLFVFCLILSQHLVAEEFKFPVNTINSGLKAESRSVIRYYDTQLEISSPSDAVLTVNYAITILNKNGLEDAYLEVGYDKHMKVKKISGKIYDEDGIRIKNLANSDILDISAISGYTIFDDTRKKVYDPEVLNFPFTVEYSFEIQLKGYINLPRWYTYPDYDISIENSSFTLRYPFQLGVRINENNIKPLYKKDIDKWTEIKWEVSNLPSIEYEPFMMPDQFYEPNVSVSPHLFEYDGYLGDASSWSNFGAWINNLNEGRDILPEKTIQEINALLSDQDSDKEKVRTLYKYMQDNTRYVSIQLGIGGFQPFEAETVDRLKYGDCKALTNYMKSILKVAGINSYYTLVEAGNDIPLLDRNFPSNQFNHAFLCVPIEKDTVWLECTDQNVPCGYLGNFTDDRDVLIINEEGGTLAHTPSYTAEQYLKSTTINVDLYENGNALANIHTENTGPYLLEVLSIILRDAEDKKKTMYNRLDLPKIKIHSFNHEIIEKPVPTGVEDIKLDIGSLGAKMGSTIFLNPNIFNQSEELPRDPEDRLSDIYIRRSQSEVDTIWYNIPENAVISSLPEITHIENQFGKYKSEMQWIDDKIRYTRYFELQKGIYPKENIFELYEFAEQVAKYDKQRIAIKIQSN